MAGTLVDFPEVMRYGELEKNKGLVQKKLPLLAHIITLLLIIQLDAILGNVVKILTCHCS